MRQALAAAALLAAAHAHALNIGTADNIEIHRVFGSEHPALYKHPAAITELENGDLYLAFYGGSGEYLDDTAVWGARLPEGESVWTDPAVIAKTPGAGVGNPVVWQAPDGVVWLFYVNRYGPTWSDAIVKYKHSEDGAKTWSDPAVLSFEKGSMVRGQPILLKDGDYLLPLYHETGHDHSFVGATTSSYFMRYNPAEGTWTATDKIASESGNLQAQVAQIDDDYLVAYTRRAGDYETTDSGYMLRTESRDGGRTWSEAVDTAFKNPNSAVDFIRLQSGNLMLVYNDNMNDRTPLTVAISTDNDESYPHRRNIIGGDNTFAYPYAIQTRDGRIHVIFTTNIRTTIMHAIFEESAILEAPTFRD